MFLKTKHSIGERWTWNGWHFLAPTNFTAAFKLEFENLKTGAAIVQNAKENDEQNGNDKTTLTPTLLAAVNI